MGCVPCYYCHLRCLRLAGINGGIAMDYFLIVSIVFLAIAILTCIRIDMEKKDDESFKKSIKEAVKEALKESRDEQRKENINKDTY